MDRLGAATAGHRFEGPFALDAFLNNVGLYMESSSPELSWTPRDYVLRGVFCPLSDVQRALDRVAEEPLVEHVLMICADQGAILRSLCMCSPSSDAGGRELIALLQDARVHRTPRIRKNALQDLVRTNVPGRSRKHRFPDSLPDIVDVLARIAERHESRAATEMMRGGRWLPMTGTLTAGEARIEPAILARVSPRSSGRTPLPETDLVDEIVTRVNGTAQADIRRDTATIARVGRRLRRARPRDEFAKGAEQLVAVASDLSEARQAACYMTSPAGGRLELVAWNPVRGGRSQPRYPKVVRLDAPAVAAAAVRRQRTIQIPPGVEPDEELRPTLGPSANDLVELAIPIPGPMASPDELAIGVLTLAKPDAMRASGEVTAFGAYDLSRLRNVALRIALLNATSRANALVSAGQALGWQPPGLADEAAGRDGTRLPNDLEDARPGIERGLKTLAEATNSHSATFRAALPFAQTTYEHGTALVRVASITPELDTEETRVQTHEDGGFNWKAALSGEIQNCPRVTDDPHFRQHRPASLSELSLPVRVEGRIVGVINLESTREGGYESFEGFGSGFAFQLGLAIADARLDSHTVLQRHAAEIVNRYHTLSGNIESLRKSAVVTDNPEAETLGAELGVLKQQAEKLRSGPSAEPEPGPADRATLPELLERAIEAAKVDIHPEEETGRVDWEPYDAPTATIIAQILHTILDNIKWHSAHSNPNRRVRIARSAWGGREEDLVIFQNKPNTRIDESVTRNLYRGPLQAGLAKGSTEAPRLGAFLAGRLTRSLNGEASATVMPDGDLRTTLAIPSRAIDRASWLLKSSTVPAR